MVAVFFATAVIYILYQTPFIALLQSTVYARGIMVLFLFVVMLIGTEKIFHTENLRYLCAILPKQKLANWRWCVGL